MQRHLYECISGQQVVDRKRAHEPEHPAAPAAGKQQAQTPVLGLASEQNALRVAGLDFLVPRGPAVCTVDTMLEIGGCMVMLSVRRHSAPIGIALPGAVKVFTSMLRKRHADFTLVRLAGSVLAGHPAISLDYLFSHGNERRHGRAACAIVASPDGSRRDWLSLSTAIDPDQPLLDDWLNRFDAMLTGMTAE